MPLIETMPADITPEILLRAYAMGIFPMAQSRDDAEIHWVDPRRRGIFPLDRFHISHSLAKAIRKADYEIYLNRDFSGTVQACADRQETWINREIFDLYAELYRNGFAHSIEVWRHDQLIGGVYGVTLGAAFFGESMFSRQKNGSKLALAWLIHRLRAGGFKLFDTQFLTPHLASLGAIEITRAQYHQRLQSALEKPATLFPKDYTPYPSLISSGGACSSTGTSSISGATKPESQDKTQTS